MPRPSNPERDAAIVAAYARHSMSEIAATYNLSRPRIHQIILKAEANGAPRARRHNRSKGPRSERVVWACPTCGANRTITQATQTPRFTCWNCYRARHDSRTEEWIASRLNGDSWSQISRRAGFIGPGRVHFVSQAIFLYLNRTNRLNEIPHIWRGRSTRWLAKRYPNVLIPEMVQ